jgi:hypothetical protein
MTLDDLLEYLKAQETEPGETRNIYDGTTKMRLYPVAVLGHEGVNAYVDENRKNVVYFTTGENLEKLARSLADAAQLAAEAAQNFEE